MEKKKLLKRHNNGSNGAAVVRRIASLFMAIVVLGMAQVALAVDCNSNGIDDTLEPDRDGDGVIDACDNCLEVSNANQLDSNDDGYGNMCDADLNNNGLVTLSDFVLFRAALGTADADADIDGNGIVTLSDFVRFRSQIGSPPGPGLPELGERLSANFTTGASSFDEGAGTVMVQIDLGVITQGSLTYTIASPTPDAGVAEIGIDFNDVSAGTVAVDGRFVDIPIEIINDDILSEPAEFIRITIEPGVDYKVGPFNQHTLSIIDNDVVWVGSLDTRGVRTELTVELIDSGAPGQNVVQGAMVSDGYGALPAGRWTATVSRSADLFDASFTAVTIPASATRFNTDFSRNIILHAENIAEPAPNPEGQSVSTEFIRGLFTEALTAAAPDKAYLNRDITGVFTLTRAYPKDSGWEPPLEVSP